MREMKDSGIEWVGQIPKDWDVVPHKQVMHKVKKICEQYSGEDIISLTMNGVIKRDLTAGGKMPTSFDGYQYVKPNDLLLCLFDIDVTPRCVGVVKDYGVTSPAYSRFVMHDGYYNAYYDYLLRAIDDDKVFVHLSKNLRSSLTESDFGAIKTCVPSLAEQKRIVKFLDAQCAEIDTVLEKTRASVEEYKKLKQAVITQAVTKGIRGDRPMKDSGIEWIGDIPVEWDVIRVKQLLKERNERSKEGKEEPLSMSQKVGLVPTKFLESIPNMASSFVGAKLAYVDDLVFNKLKAHLGVFSVSRYDGLVSPDYAVYCSTGKSNLKYLEYIFKTPQCIGEFRKKSTGIAAGLMRLYTEGLFSIYLPYPALSEQEEIAEYLNEKCAGIDALIVKKQQYLTEIENYKKSLIYEYVTGKKEVV
mgnify:CR=1 FL=1